ncbi:anti-sigma factor [Streptomyces sp. A3M-1-3]|uniref:anti-sigma factor family protein n=1 Tax=Streptomyces sp. A3M-1-3 TaxID=2962044 RepID=UPI0020B68B73|nr:zf-HC2 domain-containing protein [Streptomyces sp. A3M-1-3]MCP3818118.1 anti-sigma factor [Streptomyces sp. A3M-1-3]
MTSTTGAIRHPDVSEISDLTEGLLSPARTAEVRRHLDTCPLCADVRASLDEIRGLLGTLPGPQRMPADIAGRIDAALAAEALLDATSPGTGDAVSRETSPPVAAEPTTADRPAGHPRAATGPGRGTRTKHRRRAAVLGGVFGTAAIGMSIFLMQSLPTSQGTADKTAESGVGVTSDAPGTFSASGLEDRVQALLAAESPAGQNPKERKSLGTQTLPHSPLRDAEAATNVPPCVQAGTGRAEPLLAAEQGTYEGADAYLLVLPHPSDSSSVQAYLIDASCQETAPSGTGDVLLKRSYPRH